MVVPAPGVGWGKVMNCGGQLLVKRGEKMNDHGYSIWEQFVALGGAGRLIFLLIFMGTFAVLSESGDAGTWDPTLSGLDRHVIM